MEYFEGVRDGWISAKDGGAQGLKVMGQECSGISELRGREVQAHADA